MVMEREQWAVMETEGTVGGDGEKRVDWTAFPVAACTKTVRVWYPTFRQYAKVGLRPTSCNTSTVAIVTCPSSSYLDPQFSASWTALFDDDIDSLVIKRQRAEISFLFTTSKFLRTNHVIHVIWPRCAIMRVGVSWRARKKKDLPFLCSRDQL